MGLPTAEEVLFAKSPDESNVHPSAPKQFTTEERDQNIPSLEHLDHNHVDNNDPIPDVTSPENGPNNDNGNTTNDSHHQPEVSPTEMIAPQSTRSPAGENSGHRVMQFVPPNPPYRFILKSVDCSFEMKMSLSTIPSIHK